MADSSSNIDEVAADLKEAARNFNLVTSVGGIMLAEAIRSKIAEMLAKRSINFQMDGEGTRWAPNEARYLKWKIDHYGSNRVGAMSGQMLSILSLKGELKVSEQSLTITYGIDRPSDRHSSASPTKKATKKSSRPQPEPTDREKAGWFEDGDPKRNREPRAFFEMDDAIEDEVEVLIEDYLDRYLG